MHGLQACLFKYITDAAFSIYLMQRGADAAKKQGCHGQGKSSGK